MSGRMNWARVQTETKMRLVAERERPAPRALRASYASRCPKCRQPILYGERIVRWLPRMVFVHLSCPEPKRGPR